MKDSAVNHTCIQSWPILMLFYCRPVKVKDKVVPVLSLTEYHAMKAYRGVEVYLHIFLTPAL